MAPPPKYIQRVARLPEVLRVLAGYPDGLTLAALGAEVGVPAATLREDLTAYLDTEAWGWSLDVFRPPTVEFVAPDDGPDGPDGPDEVPADDPDGTRTVVRVVNDGAAGLGVEHVDSGDLAVVYTAGLALLDVDSDDTDLADALVVVAETMLGGAGGTTTPTPDPRHRYVGPLQRAVAERRRVRIVYSRTWHEGVTERVVEPLRLVQTQRGWEVDAGPPDADGRLRTYLLSHVRSAEVLEDTFEAPDRLADRLERQRATTRVRLQLPQGARWVADVYAERVAVVEEDEAAVVLDLDLLEPVERRVGLVLLVAGSSSRVLAPTTLLPATAELFEELIEHHGG
ncbi:WYL domain-containing protein [Nocardioides litoris]|uniref:WYL domain-containing protein n=1 Tax=Nocardioides litoris TaxID=1926648 RepID=UPI0011235053|nr:WYL domain-containing protein [Nocardioides litoris]